jgi:hypothetical protein
MVRMRHSLCAGFFLFNLMGMGCMGYRSPRVDASAGEPIDPWPTNAASDASEDRPADHKTDSTQRETNFLGTCTIGEPYVLLLGWDGVLYRYDPDSFSLTSLANVRCGHSSLNSMTVSSIGPAYISNHDGELCMVDLSTFTVTQTPFDNDLVDEYPFGMALLPDDSPAGQTLYISSQNQSVSNLLARIDLSTYALTQIGPILPNAPWAELTAGPNAGLYGFSIAPDESQLLNIDPKTAVAIDITMVPAGYVQSTFALVYWKDDFFLFIGPGGVYATMLPKSEVFRYHKGDSTVTSVGTFGLPIIGAGVAKCQ